MTNAIELRSNYSEIKNDPIALLKSVKEHALTYQQYNYPMANIVDSIRTLFNTTQKKNENLHEYTKRFKVAREVMEFHAGATSFATKTAKDPNRDVSDNDGDDDGTECQSHEQFLAYMYLENADQTKYGSILNSLHNKYALGKDHYPKSVAQAYNMLCNHKFDKSATKC